MNTLLDGISTSCVPAMGGSAPGLTFVTLQPVFNGGKREDAYLLVLVAAAAQALKTTEAYSIKQISAMDPALAKRNQAFLISAINAKRIQSKLQAGEMTVPEALRDIRKSGRFQPVSK